MAVTLDTSFRQEVRAWLEANCPPEMRTPETGDDDTCWGGRNFRFKSDAQRVWMQRMGEKGWTVPEWPREYGGGGLSAEQTAILRQEMRALKCRVPLSSFGIWMLGPALLKYGSEEQKRHYLPQIARGEIRWCQGYSEPNAGSDLASLQTRAVLDGDHFIVNGSKIWTSYADKADWIFCLVRTDPGAKKHTGISFLLFDMASPGVSTRPITLISGASPFCQTFFEDVRVPASQLVGELNGGWEIAKYLLGHERTMISSIGDRSAGGPTVSQQVVASIGLDAQGRLDDPALRTRLATLEIDEYAFRLAQQRAGDQARTGGGDGGAPSMLKYYGSELNKRRHEVLMSGGGIDALEWEGERSDNGARARAWLRTKANSIEGGTSEVQLNILVKRVLGLPGA
ncbi:MAG: acyl-CoA dehydrogenase family protein [Burkholderiaceae bacterium]